MSAITIKTNLLPNIKLDSHPMFPLPVRSSAWQRIKRHSFFFMGITTGCSFGYHLMTLNWKFSFNQAAKCFVHKGSLGLLFFYMNQIVWSWLQAQKRQKKMYEYRTAAWTNLIMTSVILFPLILGLNKFYKLSPKKTVFRSVVDCFLLVVLGLQFEGSIRKKRNALLFGTIQQKKKYIQKY